MNHSLIIFLSICLLFGVFSCTPYKGLYENGNNKAVIRGLNKKANKRTLKSDELLIFEKAIQNDLLEEMEFLNKKLASDKFEDWQEGFVHLDALEKKQKRYLSYPQANTDEMDFANIAYWDQAFSDKLYAYHASIYTDHYEKYLETDDKNHVINAYAELEKIAYFDPGDLNTDSLLQVMSELGKRTFQIKYHDQAYSNWELQKLESFLYFANNKWSDFTASSPFDYTVNITLNSLEKDNSYNQYQRRYTNEVITGYSNQPDQQGNIVEIPIIEEYAATVSETTFTYKVDVNIEVEIISNKSGKRVAYRSFSDSSYAVELEAYLINGDLRAIPENITITNGSTFTSTTQYDYTNLIERLLRKIGWELKYYIQEY